MLCVVGAEPLATAAKGFPFVIFTQPHEEGNRIISLAILSSMRKSQPMKHPDSETEPPRPDIRFYNSLGALVEA